MVGTMTDAAADTVKDGWMLETHEMMRRLLLLLLVGSISDIEQSGARGGRAVDSRTLNAVVCVNGSGLRKASLGTAGWCVRGRGVQSASCCARCMLLAWTSVLTPRLC